VFGSIRRDRRRTRDDQSVFHGQRLWRRRRVLECGQLFLEQRIDFFAHQLLDTHLCVAFGLGAALTQETLEK